MIGYSAVQVRSEVEHLIHHCGARRCTSVKFHRNWIVSQNTETGILLGTKSNLVPGSIRVQVSNKTSILVFSNDVTCELRWQCSATDLMWLVRSSSWYHYHSTVEHVWCECVYRVSLSPCLSHSHSPSHTHSLSVLLPYTRFAHTHWNNSKSY